MEVDSEAIELVAELRPVEVDVDSEATVLFAVDSPVDNELTPLCAVLMPDEAEVDSEVSELFVLLRPLDSEATLLLVVDSPLESEPMPVDVEVDSEAIELVPSSGRSKSTWTAKRRCYWWSTARWTTS
ncbi:chromosome segregation ATPase [Burkholderia pseudomallei]|nr:chromosome segregation ATPase [Burkholderia pseudomallei]